MTKIDEIRARHIDHMEAYPGSRNVEHADIAYLLGLFDALPSPDDLGAAIDGLSDAEHTAQMDVRGEYGGPCEPKRQRDADRYVAARAALQRLRDAIKETTDAKHSM